MYWQDEREDNTKGVLAMQRQSIRNATSWCNHFRLSWLQLSSSIQLERYIRVSDANIPQQILKSLVAPRVAPRVARGTGRGRIWGNQLIGLKSSQMLKSPNQWGGVFLCFSCLANWCLKCFGNSKLSKLTDERSLCLSYTNLSIRSLLPSESPPDTKLLTMRNASALHSVFMNTVFQSDWQCQLSLYTIYVYIYTYCTLSQFVNGCHQSQVGLNV